jgi:hypothetical protein
MSRFMSTVVFAVVAMITGYAQVSLAILSHGPIATVNPCAAPTDVREILLCDTPAMEKLVRNTINMKETNDEKFYNSAADAYILALSHPRFTERDAAIKELKGKIEQEYYVVIIKRATEKLLTKVHASTIAAQATAMVALTNLVVEARALKREELKETLQKIADADLQISDDLNKWVRQPLLGEDLISPSQQAKKALAAL